MDPVKIAKALSDPLRWEILRMIASGCEDRATEGEPGEVGACVCKISECMGIIQSKVSYHIKELKAAGLIKEEIRGRSNVYTLQQETLRIYLEWLSREFGL